jgi:hypothetical protein
MVLEDSALWGDNDKARQTGRTESAKHIAVVVNKGRDCKSL